MEIKRLFVGKLHTNCYIITCGNETCIIDPGDEEEKILRHTVGQNVTKILLSHGHFDHIMAADAIRKKTGAKIYISREDEPMTKNPNINLYTDFNNTAEGFSPFEADEIYSDTVTVGDTEFEVIKTPGHSNGSICFYADGELISGDTLFAGAIGRTDYGSYDEIMRSVWKLMLLDDDVRVHPGHGFSTTIGTERNENPFLR